MLHFLFGDASDCIAFPPLNSRLLSVRGCGSGLPPPAQPRSWTLPPCTEPGAARSPSRVHCTRAQPWPRRGCGLGGAPRGRVAGTPSGTCSGVTLAWILFYFFGGGGGLQVLLTKLLEPFPGLRSCPGCKRPLPRSPGPAERLCAAALPAPGSTHFAGLWATFPAHLFPLPLTAPQARHCLSAAPHPVVASFFFTFIFTIERPEAGVKGECVPPLLPPIQPGTVIPSSLSANQVAPSLSSAHKLQHSLPVTHLPFAGDNGLRRKYFLVDSNPSLISSCM